MLIIKQSGNPVSFKKRNKKKFCIKNFKIGNSFLKFNKSYLIENKYFFFFKKKIKSLIKKKKRNDLIIWFFLLKNFPISQKSKNSRMGKGKGIFLRMVSKVYKNKIFLEFSNFNIILLKKLINFLKKKNNLKISMVLKKNPKIFLKKIDFSFYNFYKRF